MTECGKRHGTMTVERCTKEQGHDKAAPKKMRRTRLAPASPPQAVLNKKWSDIRFAFLMCQLRSGGYHCHGCGLVVDSPKHLDLDHIENRNKSNYTADNAMLLCNGSSANANRNCHDLKHGNQPMWSKGESA